MADTLPNVTLPRGQWVNLYAATGITVGNRISVENLNHLNVLLVTSATEPTDFSAFNNIPPFEVKSNEANESGAWALCRLGTGLVNVVDRS